MKLLKLRRPEIEKDDLFHICTSAYLIYIQKCSHRGLTEKCVRDAHSQYMFPALLSVQACYITLL